MIIDYDHNPNITEEQRLQSLKESVQMALYELSADNSSDDQLQEWMAKVTETLNNKPETFTGTVGSGMQDGYLCGLYDPNSKMVTIHFACRSSSNIAKTDTLFTIPEKYRPSAAVTVPMIIYTSSAQAGYIGSLSAMGVLKQGYSGSARGVFGSVTYEI